MIIRHVRIRNFRGIAELDWSIRERFVVLVGPGDAGKTTVASL
jgi:putative ATP-dependent endonuclease of OLD family